jgi:hypothetical protein
MQPRSKPVIAVSIFLFVAAAISTLVGVAPLLRAAFLDRLSQSLVSLAWLCSGGSTKWAMVFMFAPGAGVRGCDWPSPM